MYDSKGKRIGKYSLSKFSTEDTTKMIGEPVFNLYRYTLSDVPAFKDNSSLYADTITTSIFNNAGVFSSDEKTLAAESAVALNLWGIIVHKLYYTTRLCESDSFNTASDAIRNIDEAVAYWIGSTQAKGDSGKGHLLYRLTEEGGELFGTEFHDGQAKANRAVLSLFKEFALQLSFHGACYSGSNTFVISQLRYLANKLVNRMTIPLIQHLIYNLKQNHHGRVKVYSHAFIPLVAACDTSLFQYLKEKLILNTYQVLEVDEIIQRIQSTYRCLDLKCKDIGHINGYPKCEDRDGLQYMYSLGDYTTLTDVNEVSRSTSILFV